MKKNRFFKFIYLCLGAFVFSSVGNFQSVECAQTNESVVNGEGSGHKKPAAAQGVNVVVNGRPTKVNISSTVVDNPVEKLLQWQEDERKNVWLELSDCAPGERFMKRLRVRGFSDDVELVGISVWPKGCSHIFACESIFAEYKTDNFFNIPELEGVLTKGDDESGRYLEYCFTPCLGERFANGVCYISSGNADDDFNNLSKFCVKVFCRKKGAPGKENSALEFEVSNEGLMQPFGLKSFENFKFEMLKCGDGSTKLQVDGLPSGVDELKVNYATLTKEKAEDDVTDESLKNFVVKREGGKAFLLPYNKLKDMDGEHVVSFYFTDANNFRYWLIESFIVEKGEVVNKNNGTYGRIIGV